MKNYVILISGRGTNMEAMLAADLPGRCAAVISNRSNASGLAYAAERGVTTAVVDHKDYADRAAFDAALAAEIDRHAPDLVVLAGFMRVLGDDFVRRYEGRLINIHPSLLPSFPGLRTHEAALAAGVKLHGATVHFVTPTLDSGPTIAQVVVPVLADDTVETLAARVLEQEHVIYPRAVRWFLEGRLRIEGGHVRLAGEGATGGALIAPTG
jgi:phosphoribosylglycinamide formyltransferase-1